MSGNCSLSNRFANELRDAYLQLFGFQELHLSLQELKRSCVELPEQNRVPLVPDLCAYGSHVRERQEIQHLQMLLVLHQLRKTFDDFRVIKVSSLGGVNHIQMSQYEK